MVLGKQSVHGVSLETVSAVLSFTRPSVQRGIDEEHVRAMVDDQAAEYHKTGGCLSMLQSITVARINNTDTVFVLDGQHRILAFDALLREKHLCLDHVILPVVYYNVKDVNELNEYYTRINKHKPVHPLELRDTWQSFEKPFVEWVVRSFPRYVKKGASTRSPHIGIEQLKTELDNRNADLVEACGGNAAALCEAAHSFNTRVRELAVDMREGRFSDTDIISPDVARKLKECEAKVETDTLVSPSRKAAKTTTTTSATASGTSSEPPCCCYLGAFRRFEWLDVCAFSLRNGNKNVSRNTCWALLVGCRSASVPCSKNSASRRLRIPQSVRKMVWSKTNPAHAFLGSCYTCGHQLSFENMECGHVVAHALGGSTDVSNLMPVCKTCNKDMGIQNMETYRRRIYEMRGDAYCDEPMWDAVSDIAT